MNILFNNISPKPCEEEKQSRPINEILVLNRGRGLTSSNDSLVVKTFASYTNMQVIEVSKLTLTVSKVR